MTFVNPSAASSGEWWKPKEHEGSLHAIVGGGWADDVDNFGNEYWKADLIIVLDHEDGPQVFRGRKATLTQVGIVNLLEDANGPVLGVLVTAISEKSGKDYWTLKDADEAQTKAAGSWWAKFMERTKDGWRMKEQGDPDESPF